MLGSRQSLRRTLTTVTGPAAEPVTLGELKAFARIDGGEEDALLAGLLTAAIESAELYLRRALITQTLRLSLDLPASSNNWTPGYFEMPVGELYASLPGVLTLWRGPVQSITSVVTYSNDNAPSTFDPSGYQLINDMLVLNPTAYWPGNLRYAGACDVTYVAGYGDTSTSVPQPIKTAVLMTAAALYESRGSCDDSGLAPGAARLLNQYRNHG